MAHPVFAYVAGSRTQARGGLPGNAPETPVPAGEDKREIASARSAADRDAAEAAVFGEFTAHVIASAARQSSPGASSIIAGEPCTVIAVRPHEPRDRRIRDLVCLEFRVYAVSTRLKAELHAASSTCTCQIRMVGVVGMRQHTRMLVASKRQTPGRRPESSSRKKYAQTG